MSESTRNPWKLVTIGLILAGATAAINTWVVAKRAPQGAPPSPTAVSEKRAGGGGPSQAVAKRPGTAAPTRPAVPSSQVADLPLQVSVFKNPPASDAGAGPPRPAGAVPSQAAIEECNRYAGTPPSQRDKLVEIAKDAAIGGAATAAVGAAAGAIAGGGKGAGKGAAIGGIVGVAAGTLYGINENRKADEEYQRAYASCMRARGYTN